MTDYNDTELHPFAISSKSFNHELECDILKSTINDLVLDDGTVEFGDLLEILHRVLVQKTILIKETVEHASVDLLVFLHFRVTETLHDIDKLANLGVNL